MAAGLFICFILSLAVVDYVFDMDIKNWLCTHLPKWSMMRKLRDHIVKKEQELDAKYREKDIHLEDAKPLGLYSVFDSSITGVITNPGKPKKVTTASGAVYVIMEERPDLPRDILADVNKDNETF